MRNKRWRKFLETPGSKVDSYVVVETYDDDTFSLKLADCDRRVQYWFNVDTKRNCARARRKIAGLREAVEKLEAIMEKHMEGHKEQT